MGKLSGKDPANVVVPPIFPDNKTVRSDLLGYLVAVEHFDSMVARAVADSREIDPRKTITYRTRLIRFSLISGKAITNRRFTALSPLFLLPDPGFHDLSAKSKFLAVAILLEP